MKWKLPDLRRMSLLYLAIPIVVFAWGWLSPLWASLITAMLAWGLKIIGTEKTTFAIKSLHLLLILAASLTLAYLGGIGGFVPQQDDYLKHNQLWQDLSRLSWPIAYQYENQSFALSYYLAYYLPPAFMARLLGVSTLPLFTFLWGSLGCLLVFLWVYRFIGKKILLVLLVLLFYGGQDFLWRFIVEVAYYLEEGVLGIWHWDEMGLPYEPGLGHKLPTHFGALSWAPQHFLPGALAGCLILNDLETRFGWLILSFATVLLLLWSPFVAIGTGVFALIPLWQQRHFWIRELWKFIPPATIGACMGLFFLAHGTLAEKGWIWEKTQIQLWPLYLLFFALLKYLPLSLALMKGKSHPLFSHKLIKISLMWFIAAMFYWMGHANDFYMRATIPAWFILSVFLAKELTDWDKKSIRKWFLLLWFMGGSIIPFYKFANHFQASQGKGQGFANTKADPTKNFIQIKELYIERGLIGKDKLWDQYVGDPDAFFFRYLAKPLNIVPTPDPSLPIKNE